MVVANHLDMHMTSVTLVTMDSEEKVQLTQGEVAIGIEIKDCEFCSRQTQIFRMIRFIMSV